MLRAVAGSLGLAFAAMLAVAQPPAWPTKPSRIIVTFPPGRLPKWWLIIATLALARAATSTSLNPASPFSAMRSCAA